MRAIRCMKMFKLWTLFRMCVCEWLVLIAMARNTLSTNTHTYHIYWMGRLSMEKRRKMSKRLFLSSLSSSSSSFSYYGQGRKMEIEQKSKTTYFFLCLCIDFLLFLISDMDSDNGNSCCCSNGKTLFSQSFFDSHSADAKWPKYERKHTHTNPIRARAHSHRCRKSEMLNFRNCLEKTRFIYCIFLLLQFSYCYLIPVSMEKMMKQAFASEIIKFAVQIFWIKLILSN